MTFLIAAVTPSSTSSVAVSVAPLPAAPMPNSSTSAPVNSLAPAYAPYNMPQQQQPMSGVVQNPQVKILVSQVEIESYDIRSLKDFCIEANLKLPDR